MLGVSCADFPEALAELDFVCCSQMPGIDTVKLRKAALALARGAVGCSVLARISSTWTWAAFGSGVSVACAGHTAGD